MVCRFGAWGIVGLGALFCLSGGAWACTNLLVSAGASRDGSVMITYTCDGEFHPHLRRSPAADHPPDEKLEIRHWDGSLLGKIPLVPEVREAADGGTPIAVAKPGSEAAAAFTALAGEIEKRKPRLRSHPQLVIN